MINTQHVIQIDNVVYGWSSREAACIDIKRFEISRKERVFLYGPSGSGKSTLLGLLSGVLVPNEGRIHVLDQDLKSIGHRRRDRFRADHIGFIFQQFNLIPYLSVIDNILLPCHFSDRRKQNVIKKGTAIRDQAIQLLMQLDVEAALHHRVASRLSIGQQQRVAAARALIGSPEIIIADEPTSALDEDRGNVFLQLLLQQCDALNATLIFVSHDHRLKPLFSKHIFLPELNKASGLRYA